MRIGVKHYMRIKRTVLILLFASIILSLPLAACQSPNGKKQEVSFFDCFDTVITISAYGVNADEFNIAVRAAKEELNRYHRLYDIYNEYEGINNIATINRLAGNTVKVDRDVIELIEYGIDAYELTDGAVNIAMGSVLLLWHDARVSTKELPDNSLLKAAAQHCDIAKVVVDADNSSVTLVDGGMSLDVGAIAKGYACDEVAKLLNSYAGSYLINCGGTVRAVNAKPDGSDWVAGVKEPAANASLAYVAKVAVTGRALAASGAYARNLVVEGLEYGHIIDPVTLYPSNQFASVSVLCSNAALADVLSTACYILNMEEGLRLIESIEGAEALYILHDGRKVRSTGFPQ